MIDVLFAAQSWPFAVALGVVALIAVLELVGLLLGFAPSHAIDSMLPHHGPEAPHVPGDGFISSALEWLAVGRVPVLVLIIAFLTSFALAGLLIEWVTVSTTGVYVPSLVASLGAFIAALPATRSVGLGLARIVPRDETEAVSVDSFIGKVATLTAGSARRGVPAEAKLTDQYDRTHYIRVEPDNDADTFARGAQVLVVSRAGGIFRVIAVENPTLRSQP